MILQMADTIIAQTEMEMRTICRSYGIQSAKVKIIPNGVSELFWHHDDSRFRREFSIEKPYVLQVGTIEPNKNQLSVIRALKETDIQLVIIGGANSTYQDYYDQCISESSENIHYAGWVLDEDMLASAYAGAQTVILPSFREIFGNSLFEGALSGANIVATNVLPLDSWGIQDYCQTINPNSIEDIYKKIKKSMDLKKTDKLSRHIFDNYSWTSVSKQYFEIYKQVVQKFSG